MANQRISELTAVVTPALTDTYVCVQANTTKKIGFDQIIEGIPAELLLPCSDESTSLTTGAAKLTFRMPYAMNVTEVRASVNTAPTGADIEVDINDAGFSILSTVITIEDSEKSSLTALTQPVISHNLLADDAEITIDIDQVGSTIAGKGLKVVIIGTRILPFVS